MQIITKAYQLICCIRKSIFPVPYDFEINPHNPPARNALEFESNFVKTSKYTWYDFFIKSLLLQFKRLANIYFLIVSIILSIPEISPLDPISSWSPLIFVLLISMFREGYQDYQRHKSDDQMNHQLKTQVYRDGKFVEVEWSKVVIGEVVKVFQQQLFPVDLILLYSSGQGGVAYIQTASLDGEKNLKPRNAYEATNNLLANQNVNGFSGQWKGIVPDKQLHKFTSTLRMTGAEPITFNGDKQLLYRGARLKNTHYILGLTIYTGRNTKIMMNSQSSSQKMSQIQVKVNYILGIILIFQLTLSFIAAILHGVFRYNNQSSFSYIDWSDFDVGADSVLMFFVYFVLINTMIPISLIVSIQIVKLCQSFFIMKDALMYSRYRKKFVDVKSASLNEQLGQIQYVFTDKTGTLTMNLMEFKIACVGKHMFGDLALIQKGNGIQPQTQKGFYDQELLKIARREKSKPLGDSITVKNKEGSQALTFNSIQQLTEQYFSILSLAHQCVADVNKKGEPIYQGPSPDQIALVDTAKSMGFQFIKNTKQSTTVKIQGQQKTFELLETFGFTSDRKRMSVLIRDKNVLKLLTKGADNIIKQRLSTDSKLDLDQELTQFSKIGLRTLLIAMRTISDAEYSKYKQEVANLTNLSSLKEKQAKYDQLVSGLESNLYLIGATAVLDRLQDQVPQTIRDLIRANIKVWMLTGDKMQTAENIAKSCKLIQDDFKILRYQPKTGENIVSYLTDFVTQAQKLTNISVQKAFLIQGHDLTPILESEQATVQFANLAQYCQAVVCCRLLPLQKAQVVSVVRKNLNKITLSIGDGANDVPMIKTAHIGIGLFGEQGMGAVQAADYALPQFRMLWRLLLVHGRWNYIRVSEMILYFFFKNMAFTIPQYIFAFYCGYSGQTLYDDYYITLYNLLFTSIPLVVKAILEQDINYIVPRTDKSLSEQSSNQLQIRPHNPKSKAILDQQAFLPKDVHINKHLLRLFPKIYFIGQQNAIFNYHNYFLWVAEGILQSILIFFFCIYILDEPSLNENGVSSDMWIVGQTMFSAVILVVTFKLATHTKFWSVFVFIAVSFLSLAFYISYMWISNYALSEHLVGTTFIAWTTAETYFVVIFCTVFVLMIDGIVLSIDFDRGGYISKMRNVIKGETYDNQSQFTDTLKLSSNLTVAAKKKNHENMSMNQF